VLFAWWRLCRVFDSDLHSGLVRPFRRPLGCGEPVCWKERLIVQDSTAVTPVRRSRWRAALAVGVLLGLFMMHGLSAFTALVCADDGAPMAVPSVARVASGVVATVSGSPAQMVLSAHCSDALDEMCVPLRPSASSTLLAALLLGLALLLVPLPGVAAFVRGQVARHGALLRAGPPVLLKVCVCRT
jgi:hypothetical protein